jgi:sec-independent protein translocase protein TatA
MLGTPEILIIAGVVVLLFGASKLPKLGGAIGESIKNFKRGVADTDPKPLNPGDDERKDDSSKS